MTRSTAPMSIPSSSDEVATRHGIAPRLSSSSTSTRCSRDSDPWCARAISFSASSFSRSASRSASRRLLTKTIVERCASTSAQQLRVDRRPDREGGRAGAVGDPAPVLDLRLVERDRRSPEVAHVIHRHDDLEVELLAAARVDEPDRARAPPGAEGARGFRAGVAGLAGDASTPDEAADLLERSLRGGEADALHGLAGQPVEPLDGEGEVRAALRPCDRVHLIEDQRADAPQHLPPLRGQEQEERLGRRDQDVGRLAQHRRALLRRRVARAHRDAQLGAEAGERAAQVALDVVVERLQRGDVEQAEPLAGRRGQPVDPVQERGQRLARAGRRLDQRVLAGGDRRPALLLRRRRRGERAGEPVARLRGEEVESADTGRVLPRPGANKCSLAALL